MNKHTGYHGYNKDRGFSYNPECTECQWEELVRIRDEKMADLVTILATIEMLTGVPARII